MIHLNLFSENSIVGFLEAFPLLTACILFRLGIINIWLCAGVASISPVLHSLTEVFFGTEKLRRPFSCCVVTSVVVYFVAVAFLLLMPKIFIVYYCVLFAITTYLSMILALAVFIRISPNEA